MPAFSISILAHNNLALTKICLEAVLRYSENYELILTDNNSTDGTWEFFTEIKAKNPHVPIQLVKNAQNLGFIHPNQVALGMASGEYFVMLNNDAFVTSSWLQIMVSPFIQFPNAALVGPNSGCSQLDASFHGLCGPAFEYLEGSCLMGKVSILKKHGLFSPELKFAYGEDSDLSLRMREQGYTLHRVPLQLGHLGGATSSRVPEALKFQEENHAWLRQRWAHYLKVRTMDYPILIRRKDAWGDVLLTTPIVRALAEQKPVSPIWVETNCTDIFRDNPYVKKCSQKIEPTPDTQVIDLDMAYENMPETHIIDAYATVAGLKNYDHKLDFYVNQQEMGWAASQLAMDRCIAIHTGPTWASKMWPADRWNDLAVRLAKEDWKVVLVGTPNNEAISHAIDLRGKTTLHQLGAVLSLCKGFVGVDSLVMHVAQAMNTPTIGVFGITDPKFIMSDSNRSLGVMGNGKTAGARHRCNGEKYIDDHGASIRTVTVNRVFKAVQETFA